MLGFALVGCGRIAKRHADILASGEIGGRLVAVCDIHGDRAAHFGEIYGVPCYPDLQEMMHRSGSGIDVVSVLTPSGDHARSVLQLAPHGRHLVVEKPLALTLDDADEMIYACDKAQIKLFVVQQNRHNLPVLKLKEALDAGRFGRLVLGTVRVRWCRTQAYYDQDDWRGTWAMDGGVFSNQASHHVDMLTWMMGEVESVFAKSITALVNIEVEDTGGVLLQFRNGALGIIEATTATRPRDLEGSISILGERGAVEIGGFAMNKLKTWSFVDACDDEEDILERYSENPPDVYGFGHHSYLLHVVDCINKQKPALVDGLDGRRSLELILAIYESIETGREVFLRFRPRNCRLGLR